MNIGLISDTHGLLRPQAVAALQGVDRIIHLGDIGKPEILEQLAQIAPVIAVRGNNDTADWALSIAGTETVIIEKQTLFLIHDVKQLNADPAAAGYDVVLSGHSHKPIVQRRGDVLFVNPGSAGPRRFKLPISVGFLEVSAEGLNARIQELEV